MGEIIYKLVSNETIIPRYPRVKRMASPFLLLHSILSAAGLTALAFGWGAGGV